MLGNYLVTTWKSASAILVAMNCGSSSAILVAMNCGSSKDQDAVGCLAGHLLSAELNVKNGANNCINPVIAQADALLVSIGYAGPGKRYTLTPQQRQQLIALKDKLDRYNNGLGC
jgi:hypothetical protein